MRYQESSRRISTILEPIEQYKQQEIDFNTLDNRIYKYITEKNTEHPIDEMVIYEWVTTITVGDSKWVSKDKTGTAVNFCVDHGLSDVLELLLTKYDANPGNISSIDGTTPLVTACIRGENRMVELLINSCKRAGLNSEFKNFINQPNLDMGECREYGGGVANCYTLKTPLMHAAYYGHLDIVKLLLKNGADCKIKDRKLGYTALDYSNGEEVYKEIAKKYSWEKYFAIKYEEVQQFFQEFVCHFDRSKIYPETLHSADADGPVFIKTSSSLIETVRGPKILGTIEEESSGLDL